MTEIGIFLLICVVALLVSNFTPAEIQYPERGLILLGAGTAAFIAGYSLEKYRKRREYRAFLKRERALQEQGEDPR